MASEQSLGVFLDLFNDTSHVVALGFVVFILLIIKPVGRMVLGGLDARSKEIENRLEQARKLKEEAQALLITYQKNQQNALEQANEIIAKAEDNAKSMVDFAHKELQVAISKRIEIVMKKIDNLESAALNEVRVQAIENAMGLVFNRINQEIDDKISDRLIKNSIASIKQFN